ncbi:MAG: bile acid:sodium symporter family protein [Acidobacteria bacterium]|nr:bile acid:sodium symporter family protein [Acidobacteriota bacterium]
MTDVPTIARRSIRFLLAAIAAAGAAVAAARWAGSGIAAAGLPLVVSLIATALYCQADQRVRASAFTCWVFAFLAAAMYYPWLFTNWGFDTGILVIPMLQLIMFGMGTKLSVADFLREFRRPKGIVLGTLLVFTVMPVAGVLVARAFGFAPEIAVGVILIGACPGGAASNVMAYLARGNVALCVSVTTLTTLLTPLATPALMKLSAGALIEVPFLKMTMSSLNLILVPVAAGLVCHRILYGTEPVLQRRSTVAAIGVLALFLAGALVPLSLPAPVSVLKPGLILGFALVGIVALARVAVAALHGPSDWMNRILPKTSMVSILLYVTIVVALNRDELLRVGLLLVAASAAHNLLGFVLGYWASRAAGLSRRDSRTLSIEVGLKNGGLGMGLALEALNSPNAALAPIVFGKWMNISGSALANYWRSRPTGESDEQIR